MEIITLNLGFLMPRKRKVATSAQTAVLKQRLVLSEERIHYLESTINSVLKSVEDLRSKCDSKMHVPFNEILIELANSVNINVVSEGIMTKSQYEYAKHQLLAGAIMPTNYNRNPSGRDGGLTFKDICILNSFLHFICSESSESQHVSGMSVFHV